MTTDPGSPLDRRAFPFMPADPDRHGATIEAPAGWHFALPAEASGARRRRLGPPRRREPVVGPRPPLGDRARARPGSSRRPTAGRFRVAGIHRLAAGGLSGGLHGRVRTALRAGALVELTTLPPGARVLDAVLSTVDARLSGPGLAFGSGGTLIARVARGERGRRERGAVACSAWPRSARRATPPGPARRSSCWPGSACPWPRVRSGDGTAAGASWTVESLLPGRRPAGLAPQLVRQVAAALAAFPRTDGPPLALEADLRGIVARVPSRAERTARLAESIAAEVADLPAVLRHGDLWTGNLLVADGTLSGIIDWDAAHPAGVPGSDLVQLVATELRGRQRRSLGAAYVARPWDSTEFRVAAADYWPAIGIEPSPRLIELAGLAWWAAEVNGTVSRLPHRATDERWLTSNVDPVLAALGY